MNKEIKDQESLKLNMTPPISAQKRCRSLTTPNWLKSIPLLALSVSASIQDMTNDLRSRRALPFLSVPKTVDSRASSSTPLIIENRCDQTIWPAIASQHGNGPASMGFALKPGETKSQTTSQDWQGRVWGRTNCSFNTAGTGPANINGGKACSSGDCAGVLNCVVSGDTPVTLFEVLYAGGTQGSQDYYDISLVDGYNLPMGLTYMPSSNSKSKDIPPNLTNAACIGTAGWIAAKVPTNTTYPVPYTSTTNAQVAKWCPWNLQLNPPTKPGDGVYPYPDDNIQRPVFNPCNSACASTNKPSDCCTGSYNSPDVCKPGLYSTSAKSICPDAYSFAFDDQTSTFIIPTGGGWHITFCPVGKSTNILNTFGKQLLAIASGNTVSTDTIQVAQNVTLVQRGDAPGIVEEKRRLGSLGALVVLIAWLCIW